MRKILPVLVMIVFFCQTSMAKPSFTKSKYLIAVLENGTTGTVSPGVGTYQLVFNSDRDSETAKDSDYWVVKNLGADKYAFQNAVTLQYIWYNPSTGADRSALQLVGALQSDESTSFTLELRQNGNYSYYVIRSVSNVTKVWNKRRTAYDGVYPVGMYVAATTAAEDAAVEDFLFYGMDGDAVIDDGSVAVTMPKATQNLGAFENYMDSLSFGGKVPVVDTSNKKFFLSIPENLLSTNWPQKVYCSFKDSNYKLYIFNEQLVSGSNYTFRTVSPTIAYTMEVRNGTIVVASGTIYFSSLPLVQLYTDATINATYQLGRITVTEPDTLRPAEILLSNLKTRGAYSAMASIPKKAYAIKLKDYDGATSMDRSFFGLRNDNNWILDAMCVDPGRMRNRVSTDLWNDFATKPYYAASEPKMRNGTRGQFVEVFVNDVYVGLYCMTEKIDRKQLNVKKYKAATSTTGVIQRGALWKADEWSVATVMGNPNCNYGGTVAAYNNTSETWCCYAVKYPDLGDGEPIEWKQLYDAVYFTSYLNTDTTLFKTEVAARFDLPNYLDYYLFIELLLAADNQGKNTYLSIYDRTVSNKISITPWDLDATWGRRWDGSSNMTYASQNFDTFVSNYEHGQNNLFIRLKAMPSLGWMNQLKARYKELRGTYFDYTRLMARFQAYSNKFKTSGAAAREYTKWSAYTAIAPASDQDLAFLSTWITARLLYLDKQYLGAAYTDLDEPLTVPSISVYPNPVRDWVTVRRALAGTMVQVVSLQGRVVARVSSDGNDVLIDMSRFAPGVYLVKAGSATIKVIKE
jgi:hypothetical protein